MDRLRKKLARRGRIRRGIRSKIQGTAERPRLSIYRSNKEIYAQLIDDLNGKTLLSVSSLSNDLSLEGKPKVEQAQLVGKAVGEKAKEANITKAVFDRNGYLYHGRVKALADGVREGGLKI